jgi:hypothetical protein
MFLHDNPAATVIELVSDYEGLSHATMSLLPSGTILASQIKYAVAGSSKEDVEKDANLSVFGEPFSLGGVNNTLPTDIPQADLLVIPQSIDNLDELKKVLLRLTSLSKPNAAVVFAVNNNLKGAASVLKDKGFRFIFDVAGADKSVALYKQQQSEQTNGTLKNDFIIIEPSTSSSTIKSFSSALKDALEDKGYSASATTRAGISARAADEFEGKTFISLLELEQALLDNLSQPDFNSIRKLVLNSERLLWINCGNNPSMGVVDGLARTMKSDASSIKFQVLHLSSLETALKCGPALAARVVTSDTKDDEFRERRGLLQVARIFNSIQGNESVRHCLEDSVRVQFLSEQDNPLRLTIGKPGLLDTLTFIDDDRMEVPLGETEVEVDVKATGVK